MMFVQWWLFYLLYSQFDCTRAHKAWLLYCTLAASYLSQQKHKQRTCSRLTIANPAQGSSQRYSDGQVRRSLFIYLFFHPKCKKIKKKYFPELSSHL